MKTKETAGKKLDNLQVDNMVKLIKEQKETKKHDPKAFFSLMLNSFINTFKENPFYKETPVVFLSLSVFYVQASRAFNICYPDLKTTPFDFCHYLNSNTMFCPEIYQTKYTAFDVDASEASRILKDLKIFTK